MGAILDILISLGLDKTVFVQFVVFMITFLFLEKVIFKPYLKAYIERRKRTVDSGSVETEVLDKITDLENQYSIEAKEVKSQINQKFSAQKENAAKDGNAVVIDAQKQASEKLDASKKLIDQTYAEAKKNMDQYIPEIVQDIKTKVVEQ